MKRGIPVAWQGLNRMVTGWLVLLIVTVASPSINAEGWVSLLTERLEGDAHVINASISGETTSGGLQRFTDILRQHQPDIVLLELGGNDGLRGLAPNQMQANLASMIEQSQESGAQVLLLGIDIPPNYGQAYRDAFTGVFLVG